MKNTYMMFTKRGQKLEKVVGPFFYSERDKIQMNCFPQGRKVEVIEETSFATYFPDTYFNHIKGAWMDKMYCYFSINSNWCSNVQLSLNHRTCTASWFHLQEMCDDGYIYLQLNFSVEANPFHVAKLKQDLEDMETLQICIGPEYYENVRGVVTTKRPVSRMLAQRCIDNACLT